MPGTDSSYQWQGFIPQAENPHVLNPECGFLESANQRPVDSTYPYFIPGNYITPRGIAIEQNLARMNNITVDDMKALQNNFYSVLAGEARKVLLKYTDEGALDADAKNYLTAVKKWDLNTTASSTATTIYQTWMDSLKTGIWGDEWRRDSLGIDYPSEETLVEWINKDSAFKWIDDVNTARHETINDVVTQALVKATAQLKKDEIAGKLEWAKHKDPTIFHLLKSAVPSFARKIPMGGWGNVINAVTETHGPSWRMIVQLSSPTEAWGVYPGGQDGNPGSPFYDNFVETWSAGNYYRLWMMKQDESADKRIIGQLHFTKA